MGRSPGKWIKAKLFGKKSTKSTISERGKSGKEAFIVSKVSSGAVATKDPVISNPQPVIVHDRNGHTVASGNQTVAKLPDESNTLSPAFQDGGAKSTGLISVDKSELLKQEQAAAKVQAALRGYLARRAFWALKGIIRLQALIRGHLVRRQAVATLHCMQGIVKFQALVRGHKVRLSEAGVEVKEKCNPEKLKLDTVQALQSNRPIKLSRNAFALKLLASLPNASPLYLHYDSFNANSAWNWLERWSSSHFWEVVVEHKKENGSKSSRKSGGNKGFELENGRAKHGARRNSSTKHDTSSDNGKPRGTMKKSISHQAAAVQDNPQNELEKVKRNLRKVSLTKSDSNGKPETVTEKPKIKTPKICDSANPVAPDQGLNSSLEKLNDPTDSVPNGKHELLVTNLTEKDGDSVDAITKEHETVIPPQQVVEKLEYSEHDNPSSEELSQSIQKDSNPLVVVEVPSKEDSSGKENQKARRRKSLSAKHEYPETDTQNTPTLPSYMQATQSAKAKLRAQGSPRLSQDTPDNGVVRRHSLPSSTGSKLNTPSPRIQKLVTGSGKGGIESDKSLSASKDYSGNGKLLTSSDRVADWRR